MDRIRGNEGLLINIIMNKDLDLQKKQKKTIFRKKKVRLEIEEFIGAAKKLLNDAGKLELYLLFAESKGFETLLKEK